MYSYRIIYFPGFKLNGSETSADKDKLEMHGKNWLLA